MRTNDIETSCFNYLDGQEVGDVEKTLADFMENVIDPDGEHVYTSEAERERIEEEARAWFESWAAAWG